MRIRLAVIGGAALCASAAFGEAPKGWYLGFKDAPQYEAGVDRASSSAWVRSRTAKANQFGSVHQYFSAEQYRGKRLRFSAALRCDGVEQWAGLWMRVDGQNPGVPLAFDNMQDRPLRGTVGWTRVAVVLDVPADANGIAIGDLITGAGALWMKEARFEVVDQATPLTGHGGHLPREPVNLELAE
jgi:hypothetical protein